MISQLFLILNSTFVGQSQSQSLVSVHPLTPAFPRTSISALEGYATQRDGPERLSRYLIPATQRVGWLLLTFSNDILAPFSESTLKIIETENLRSYLMVIYYTEIYLGSRWRTLMIHKLIKAGHNKIGSNNIHMVYLEGQ